MMAHFATAQTCKSLPSEGIVDPHMKTKHRVGIVVGLVLLGAFFYIKTVTKVPKLVIYSARSEALMTPIFEAYTQKTGVEISYQIADAGVLMNRLKSEGDASPADIFIATEAVSLAQATTQGLLYPLKSDLLFAAIPASLRDAQGHWFGYASFAITAVYHPKRVSESTLSTYTNFVFPQWKGRLLLRSSRHIYNKSLFAMWMNDRGDAETSATLSGWVFNLAAPPFDTDRQVLEALEKGKGDVGIVNSSEFGHYKRENPKTKLRLSWLDQPVSGGLGVQVNVSGGGILAKSKHIKEAQAFLEWLITPEAQHLWANLNNEFPVSAEVTGNAIVESWGLWYRNPISVEKYATHMTTVMEILDGAGYE